MADQLVQSAADAVRVAQAGAADLVSLKLPKMGSVAECVRVIGVCAALGLGVHIGGSGAPGIVDSALTRLALAHSDLEPMAEVGESMALVESHRAGVTYDGPWAMSDGLPGLGGCRHRLRLVMYCGTAKPLRTQKSPTRPTGPGKEEKVRATTFIPQPDSRQRSFRMAAVAVTLGLGVTLTACGSGGGNGTSAAESNVDWNSLTVEQLYEGAKKEGKFVLFSGQSEDDLKVLAARFYQQYPDIEIEHFEQVGEDSASKLAAEANAGVHTTDIIDTEQNTIYQLAQLNLLSEYTPPAAATFDSRLKKPWFTGHRIQIKPITYNTQRVPAADAPKDYDDLLDQQVEREGVRRGIGSLCLRRHAAADGPRPGHRLLEAAHLQWTSLRQWADQPGGVGHFGRLRHRSLGERPQRGEVHDQGSAGRLGQDRPALRELRRPWRGGPCTAPLRGPTVDELRALRRPGQQSVADDYRIPVNPDVQPKERELRQGTFSPWCWPATT